MWRDSYGFETLDSEVMKAEPNSRLTTYARSRAALLLFAVIVLLSACKDQQTVLHIGVERSLEEAGIARRLQRTFEETSKQKTKLVFLDAAELLSAAEKKELDLMILGDEASIQAVEKEGLGETKVLLHEEFVFIGPYKNILGTRHRGDAVEFMRNVSRANYRYFKGRPGSSEALRHAELFAQMGDRQEPGAFLANRAAGKTLVKKIVAANAMGLVRRSSVVLARAEGVSPHRIYKDGAPGLVLRYVVVKLHPKLARSRGSEASNTFFSFLFLEDTERMIAEFGKKRFGHPLFAVGAPEPGEGAKLPEGYKRDEGVSESEEEK